MFGNACTLTCQSCHSNCELCIGPSSDDCIEILFNVSLKSLKNPVKFILEFNFSN